MRITCPQCGFFRELPDNKVPVTSTMATCPKCRHRFKFRPDPTTSYDREYRAAETRPQPPASSVDEPSSWRRRHRTAEDAPEPEQTPVAPTPPQEEAPAPVEQAAQPPLADQPGQPEPPASPELADDPVETVTPAPRRATSSFRLTISPPPEPPHMPEPPAATPEPSEPEPEAWHFSEKTPPEPDETFSSEPEPVVPEEPAKPIAAKRPQPVAAPEEPPVTRRRREPPAPEPDASASRSKRGIDKDGVRDIWARLQAMDNGAQPQGETPRSEEAAPEEKTPPEPMDPVPWECQEKYGVFPSLFWTLRRILLQPSAFFAAMPEGRPKGRALVFNLLISEFLFVIDFLWTLMGLRAGGQGEFSGALPASKGLSFLVLLLLVPPLLTCGIYIDAWLTHLLLRLFRNARKSFAETFRVLCYSAAPTVLSAVPIAGQILSPVILVWYMALQALGLKKIHEGAYTQILAAVFIKWSLYLFLLLAMLQSFAPGK